VSCIALSRSGKYLASGQVTYMGFTAPVLLWDLETLEVVHKMDLHKVKVQALSFSPDDPSTGQPRFLASLGGQDDNSLVLWEVETGAALCGSPTHNDFTVAVQFFTHDPKRVVTCGNYNLDVWEYDETINKLKATSVNLGSRSRIFTALTVDDSDQYAYVGSSTGDIMKISLSRNLMRAQGPARGLIEKGVVSMAVAPDGMLLVGGGTGALAIASASSDAPKIPVLAAHQVGQSGISSISVDSGSWDGRTYTAFVATADCDMYRVVVEAGTGRLASELVQTAHRGPVNCLAFPYEYSECFATAATEEVRVWHLDTCRELLRICVPNVDCQAVAFTDDGKLLLSGWSDGKIRAFGPQTGRLVWTIHDAHPKGVTAITSTSDSRFCVSGGGEGTVRVWSMGRDKQALVASMKEHKGAVVTLAMRNSSDEECVSASADGSCIVWDLATMKRRVALQANTMFKGIAYHPDDSQLVSCGTDRKLTYWDTFDGQPIRIIDGSDSSEVTALCMDAGGSLLVSGSGDKQVRLWHYDDSICTHVGTGHSGAVTGVLVAPDRSRIVSVGAEGGVFVWDRPEEHAEGGAEEAA